MDNTLLQTIQSLEERAEQLERAAAALRRDIKQVVLDLAHPETIVATYEIGNETIAVTQGEVEAVRAGLTRSRPENVVREVALAYKLAENLPAVEPDEEEQLLLDLLNAYRQEVIAQGGGLDDDEIEAFLRGDTKSSLPRAVLDTNVVVAAMTTR